jgi:hypothetical protein
MEFLGIIVFIFRSLFRRRKTRRDEIEAGLPDVTGNRVSRIISQADDFRERARQRVEWFSHDDFQIASPRKPGTVPQPSPGTDKGERHHGSPGLHRNLECTQLERTKAGGVCEGSFGEEENGSSFLEHISHLLRARHASQAIHTLDRKVSKTPDECSDDRPRCCFTFHDEGIIERK